MKYCPNLSTAVHYAHQTLVNTGSIITTESWQGIKKPIEMFEAFDVSFKCPVPHSIPDLEDQIKPNLPWAFDHFQERISSIPYNPPPSSSYWPHGTRDNEAHKKDEKFSHTYPERFWPKSAGNDLVLSWGLQGKDISDCLSNKGIRFNYGDYNDVIDLLNREPHTRQAYLPIWFPEDTGAVEGQRVPCTLGYLFRYFNGYMHITYKIRSCDYLRHFRDDVYMAVLLLYDILFRLRMKDDGWDQVKAGEFKFQADSLHVFAKEKNLL